MTILNTILQHKIVAILRGFKKDDVPNIAEALYEGGIRLLEVTLNSADALHLIRTLSVKYEDKMLIGAGTVLTVKDARKAIDTGAKFLISPITDTEVIKTALDSAVVSIPGAFTPSEIYTGYEHGADLIKIFPSPSPEYIKNLLAPLNNIPVMPTGGIGLENIKAYKNAGASAFGIGSSLVNSREEINDSYLKNLSARAQQFVDIIKQD
ncbi:MAG: bifunctional 4-hydroxy-2-oxoglutarate aldolase/2-dehydro-3-deoxy-phosphogluconate aldolase [Ginsengibacter sp.]